MAAGLGFKDFVTGEVLTAADVDGYLMQGIWVFTNATARDAAVTSPQEGNFAFTKDNNSLWYYDGAAWVASGATGDIEGVTAGIGISGGGTSGTVTVTNSMATAIDAKGDLVAGTGADTFAKLTVGANNTVLTADSSEATGLKWATPASGGGITLLSTTSLTGTETTISSISGSYRNLYVIVEGVYTSGTLLQMYLNTDSLSNYNTFGLNGTTADDRSGQAVGAMRVAYPGKNASGGANTLSAAITIYNYATSDIKSFNVFSSGKNGSDVRTGTVVTGSYSGAAVTSIKFDLDGSSFGGGTAKVYGVN
jgi:hypothetical protein